MIGTDFSDENFVSCEKNDAAEGWENTTCTIGKEMDFWDTNTMKRGLLFLTFLMSYPLWAKPLVLISYFDPFGNASSNVSQAVAMELESRFHQADKIQIKLCQLQTIYEKAFGQLEDCYKNSESTPALILGLGESNCEIKLEVMVKNRDKSFGPDNAGIERRNTPIIPEAPQQLGLKYPLPQMFCPLSKKEKRHLTISQDMGSFVCNNAAFQMSYYYPEIPFGFIHVPTSNCRNIDKKMKTASELIEKMILNGVEYLKENPLGSRLSTTKSDKEISQCEEKKD